MMGKKIPSGPGPWGSMLRRLLPGMAAALLLLWAAAYWGGQIWFDPFREMDRRAEELMAGLRSPGWTAAALAVTACGSGLGESLVLAALAPVLAFGLRRRAETVLWLFSLSGAWALNELMKEEFRRVRPEWEHLAEAGGYSFPSGHAMVSLVFYGLPACWLWEHFCKRGRPLLGGLSVCAISLFILLIGSSRIYLGVHYASDVLAGFAAGGVWLAVCMREMRRIEAAERPGDEIG